MNVQADPQGAGAPRPIPGFADVFREHAPFAWRALRQLGVPEAEAEDLCQEVFVVVHRKLAGFEGRSSLRTWIYGICARVASDYRRRAHVRREKVMDRPPERAGSAPQQGEIERRQAKALLDTCLCGLDADKREVFVLFEIEELSMVEVATALSCPLQTAYSRLYAARKAVTLAFGVAVGEGAGA